MDLGRRLTLESKVNSIGGIGPVLLAKLANLGIETVRDLLYFFPFRYEDLSNVKPLAEVQPGEQVSLQATLWQISKFKTPRGKTIIRATINDGNSSLEVIWFNQDYLLSVLKPNQTINFSGKVGLFGSKIALINPAYEILKAGVRLIHTQGLVPVYSEARGLSKKWLRTKIYQLLFKETLEFVDLLPPKVVQSQRLLPLQQALEQVHFPKQESDAIEARKRFAFEELLLLQLANLKNKEKFNKLRAPILKVDGLVLGLYEKSLPFKLTHSQKEAIGEILGDISKTTPMNRLLQGEVGSGKTVVSSFAIKVCLDSGFRAAFMAPTEILAKQHYQTLTSFLGEDYKIALITGKEKLNLESAQLLIGTHALLNQTLDLENLGLVVIDEQQRFGVAQRFLLRDRAQGPHFLTMTATPIPRTLALTLFGDLSISRLQELPSDRKRVKTYVVPRGKRSAAYDFIKKQIALGDQVLLVCPLIESSETLSTVKAASVEFETLRKQVFKTERLGLLHGKLASKEKAAVLSDFRNGDIDLLVSTPVVEVGIDIPNATVVVIEAAERFGLASLHQLRGRVGRGPKQSFCLMFTDKEDQKTLARLSVLQKSTDGFFIAEQDMKLRGAGNIYSTLQHGHFKFKLMDATNLELIAESREVAKSLATEGLEPLLEGYAAELEKGFANVSLD